MVKIVFFFWFSFIFQKGKFSRRLLGRAKGLSFFFCWGWGIFPFLGRINSPSKVCDLPDTGESVRKMAVGPLFENYKIADGMLARREYFFDHFTVADAHFFWCFRRGLQFKLDLSGFPNCSAHYERMTNRPSVQKLLSYEKAILEEFAKAA